MLASTDAAAAAVEQPLIESRIPESPVVAASTTRYIASAERTLALSDIGWKLGVGLLVLFVIAWALGVLPGAARPF